MRPKPVLVVSPNAKLRTELEEGLARIKKHVSVVSLPQYPTVDKFTSIVERHQPSLVLVGLSEPARALQIVESLRRTHPDITSAIAHTIAVSELILEGMRAGARDSLTLPVNEETLEELLSRPAKVSCEKAELGRMICFLPARGSSGGSTAQTIPD